VGWHTILLPFEPHVDFKAGAAGPDTDLLTIYVPSRPHPKGPPVAFVDSQSFHLSLTTGTTKTFAPDLATQKKMLHAMKMGKLMLVKWTDADGARQEDRYPLGGFAEAYAEVARACP
jgi:hypothetical protein